MGKNAVIIHPPLDGIAAERFLSFGRQLERWQSSGQPDQLQEMCEREIRWVRSHPHLDGMRELYEAATRVLVDLARLRWEIHQVGYEIELLSSYLPPRHSLSPKDIDQSKQSVRDELAPLRDAQLSDVSVQRFIRRLEQPSAASRRKSIRNLIADGRELHGRIADALRASGCERSKALVDAVQPYLQLVEAGAVDEFTGIPLSDIWRYFRYTWVIPQLSIPGRQLLYLVRDAAHPFHAVMGIASLNNSSLQMKDRDDFIGWTFEAFVERARQSVIAEHPRTKLEQLLAQLEANIARSLTNIETRGLVTLGEVSTPTPEVVARLRRRSEQFARTRAEWLKYILMEPDQPELLQELEELPPVSSRVLKLEDRALSNPAAQKAREMLVAKKRAFELARLLQARIVLRASRSAFAGASLSSLNALLSREEFQIAVNTALLANKSARAGSNMLELTTCGAIRPYNVLLGGKLVALLMLSPQVADDYRKRYGDEPSIISSQMKNGLVRRDSTLVYVGTTSLYAHGSSQYERLQLPTGIISPQQKAIRYQRIGYTSGYGTVQFSAATVRAVEAVLSRKLQFKNVNSIFGEGPSPRLRKLHAGLEELGFDPEFLMRHHQQRIIYGAVLSPEGPSFLRGEQTDLPSYLVRPSDFRHTTEKIAAYWRDRWLSARLNYAPAMQALTVDTGWCLSDELMDHPPQNGTNAPPPLKDNDMGYSSIPADIAFWRSIAWAGSKVCSEDLSEKEQDWLHVSRPVEDFIVKQVRAGYSIVLTGNAGDGKTHLLQRLRSVLADSGAVVQTDATAAMKRGNAKVVVSEWRKAINDDRPYCIAANEYPLYQLRSMGTAELPVLREVDRQCRQRLSYGPVSEDETAADKVIVIDLSLRNPLVRDFSTSLLDRLLGNTTLAEYAAAKHDPNFTRNYNRLSHPLVRERLLDLLGRLVTRGIRAPVRELWIVLCKLLFGAHPNATGAEGAVSTWYSERLFEPDGRLALAGLLRAYCDPARYSHPQWDAMLDRPSATQASQWLVDGQEPIASLRLKRPEEQAARFDVMKRIFYFEHEQGPDAFALEQSYAKEFRSLLAEAEYPDDSGIKERVVTAINYCYCPRRFSGIGSQLYLWIGHRFHELPTRSYVANQSIPSNELSILLPRLPRRLADSLDYDKDHFLLRHTSRDGKTTSLRVDFDLFSTLSKLENGLPRHLVSERDVNRLDAFIEQLQLGSRSEGRRYIAFNAERRIVTRLTLSPDRSQYAEIADHD